MDQSLFHLSLDKQMLLKVSGYYLYRSQELRNGRPVIDGLYIQRDALTEHPPEEITVSIGWNSSPAPQE